MALVSTLPLTAGRFPFLKMSTLIHSLRKLSASTSCFALDSQSVASRSAASASGSLLEVQILGPQHRPTESETLEWGPAIYSLMSPSGDSNAQSNLIISGLGFRSSWLHFTHWIPRLFPPHSHGNLLLPLTVPDLSLRQTPKADQPSHLFSSFVPRCLV